MSAVPVIELTPFDYNKFSHPIVLNDDEYIIIPANGKTRFWTQSAEGICKYNIKKNKWSTVAKYPSTQYKITMMATSLKRPSFTISNPLKTFKQTDIDIVNGYINIYCSISTHNIPKEICQLIIAFGVKDNELYMFCDQRMVKVDLNNGEFLESQTKYRMGDSPGVVFVDNDNSFHIVGGRDSSKHIKYDINTLEMEKIYDFRDEGQHTFCNMGFVYIPTQNVLILFGGYNTFTNGRIHKIWKYSVNKNIWEECVIQLENAMNSFGYVLTNDQKYIIIFGGVGQTKYGSIYVLDVINMKWRHDLRKELDPKYGGICCAVIMPNDEIYVVKRGLHFKVHLKDIIP